MTTRDYRLEEFFRSERIGGKEVLIGLAEGDIPNSARVIKVNSQPGDGHQDGALGTVVGALEAGEKVKAELRERGFPPVEWIYWVRWDDLPEVPVGIADYRIERQREIFFAGPCPFLTCLKQGPHSHPICPDCGAVKYGNPFFCPTCRKNLEKELLNDPGH